MKERIRTRIRTTRHALVLGACIGVLAGGVILGVSYVLVVLDDHHAGGETSSSVGASPAAGSANASPARAITVSQVSTTQDLHPEAMLIAIPLETPSDPQSLSRPGQVYGGEIERPIQLGPGDARGIAQDGFSTQAGILLPDGRRLLYHFWRELREFPTEAPGEPVVANGTPLATPSIRVIDLVSGADSLVASGARSMAWRRGDGMFAYAKGVDADYRYNVVYRQRIVVQKGLDGPPRVWTSKPDFYTVVQWAGDSLLVWRQLAGEARELLALDGPDKITKVLPVAEQLVAVSSDGERMLTWSGGPLVAQDRVTLREIEWRSGREIARMSFDTGELGSEEAITGIGAGCWEGDRVIMSLAGRRADLAAVSTEGDVLSWEQVVTFKYSDQPVGGIGQLLLAARGSTVLATIGEGAVDRPERTALLACDLSTGKCSRWIVSGTPAAANLVANPRRP